VRRLAALLLVAALLTGCGAGGPKIATARLPSIVLQPRDLGGRYLQFTSGAQTRSDAHLGPRHDLQRFGRLGGWITRYRIAGGASPRNGPAVVESRADLFPSAGAAGKDLDAYGAEYDALVASAGGKKVSAPHVGDDARAFTFGSGGDRFFAVAWRAGNATASVVVEGSHVSLADAVALARKQQKRVSAAA
jgi:hypothetical protein